MLYIKRLFLDKEETSMSIEEAKEAIKARKNVCAAISEKEGYHPTSFIVKHVIGIVEDDGAIVIKTKRDGAFKTEGWDTNARQISPSHFIDYTWQLRLHSVEAAKEAVEMGHDVRACGNNIQTSNIVKFLGNDLFETYTGSMYQIV